MKSAASREHILDILFPLSLLLAFAAFSMLVLLAAADIYGDMEAESLKNHTASTVTAYLTEKVHQNDASGAVSLGKLQGKDALILEHAVDGETYCTYLYQYEDALRELLIKKGTELPLSSGQKLLPLESLEISWAGEGLLCFASRDPEGNTSRTYAAVRSLEEEKPWARE